MQQYRNQHAVNAMASPPRIKARTVAEESRRKQRDHLDHKKLRAILDDSTNLNLDLLPPETKFKVCKMEYSDSDDTIYVDDNPTDQVLEGPQLKSLEATLRQTNLVNVNRAVGHLPTPDIGLQLKLPSRRGEAWRPVVWLDGTSYVLRLRALECLADVVKHGLTKEIKDVFTNELRDPNSLQYVGSSHLFIGQHTISFPRSFVNRSHVSFLGLPEGAIVPTKNGGMFRVVRRENIHLDSNNETTGHLLLEAMNTNAVVVAEENGWAERSPSPSGRLYLASGTLICSRDAHRVVTDDIKLPWANPLKGTEHVLGLTVEPKIPVAEPDGRNRKDMVYHTDKESLADAIDDFLFG